MTRMAAGIVFVLLTVIFAVMGMGGLPSYGSGDGTGAGGEATWSPTAVPTTAAASAATPAPVRSDLARLDVTANVDSFEVELLGGSRADDIVAIEIAVSDNYGRHVVSWQYPFIGERFYLPLEMYGGSLYGTRYLRCEAVFGNGDREVVFAQYYT
ncbi:hypothetical protein AZH53_10080 [Methanomicrobiaceae archaeon CYW5]|nr:hypothetical protein [Methanovulcanius yangii]